MVKVVDYGSLEAGSRPLAASTRRAAVLSSIVGVASVALVTLAVVFYAAGAPQKTELYMGSGNPTMMTEEMTEGIWATPDEAWEGIDEVLPTEAEAWEDQSEPAVGYVWKNPGSVTAENGWAGYYDTNLHDETFSPVLPEYVNDAMGYDPTLSGTNVFWGDRGGQSAEDPAPWHKQEVHNPPNLA